jgi:hypothetical protein
MELRIEQKNLPEPLKFNYDELKTQIEQVANDYAVSVYTEDMIKSAKADKAKLNALKKSLNDERLRREREWMEPFQDFKAKINEIISIIDRPIQIIDKQVKEYDERQKREKQNGIEDFFEVYKRNNDCPEWLESSDIFCPKWLNATCSTKTWQTELTDRIKGINADIETILGLPDYSFEAMQVYRSTLNLAEAMREGKRLADIQKAKEEAQKAQELKEQEQKILADKVRGTGKSPSEAEIEAFSERVENDKAALKKSEIDGVKRWWVDIRACVTMNQANDLKAYFAENDIEYTATTER